MASPPAPAATAPRWLPWALLLLCVGAQIPVHDRNFVPMDEGHLALTATRLLEGDLLYRDIHTGIFPLVYQGAAALYGLFGADLIVTRYAQIVVNCGTVMALWWIGVRLVPWRWALLPPLAYVALVWLSFPVLSMFNYAAIAEGLALFGLLFGLRYLAGGRSSDGVLVGVLVGLSLFTKQNVGALAAGGLAAGLLVAKRHSALRDRSVLAVLAPATAAGAAVVVLAVAWLAASGLLAAWVDRTFLSLVGPQLASFDNPIPPILGAHPEGDGRFLYLYLPSTFFDYLIRGHRFVGMEIGAGLRSATIRLLYGLPLATLAAAVVLLALGRRDESDTAPGRAAALATVSFAIAGFFGIFPSAVYSHLVYVLGPILLVGAWLGADLEARLAPGRPLARAPFVAAAATTALLFGACATIPVAVRSWYHEPSGLPGVSLRVAPDQATLNALALGFIDGCAGEGEPIFTLPILPILYVASGRPNPVKWDLLIPGAIDEEAIVAALEAQRVACVVMQRDMNPEFPPLARLYPTLHAYVRDHYQRGRELRGGDQLWYGLRRSEPFRDETAAAP